MRRRGFVIYFYVIVFLTTLQAQVNTRQTGNYNSCFTWADQVQIGYTPAQILSANTVTLINDANTYQSLSFQDANSVLDLNGKALNLNTTTGAINMDYCPISFVVSSYTSNGNGCVALWPGANNSWPQGYNAGGYDTYQIPFNAYLNLTTITRPGNYKIMPNSLTIATTFPPGQSDGVCWAGDFQIIAYVMKNNSIYYTLNIQNYGNNNGVGRASFPNCVNGYPSSDTRDYRSSLISSAIDFGYCNTGDIIQIRFNTTSNCKSGIMGSMRGLATYNIQKY